MKITLPNGDTLEIKVIHEGAKKADEFSTDIMAMDLSMALTKAAVFCEGNGMHTRAREYAALGKAIGEAVPTV